MIPMPPTALDAIRRAGIIVASDTGEYNKIREFGPTDATTNPSLVLAAVSQPEYAHLIGEAARYAHSRRPDASVGERTELALDRLLVQLGAQILSIVPGRVSVSVDPRLAYNHDAIVKKGKALIALFEELQIPHTRVLIKIPATYPGILAAQTLEASTAAPIHTNMTLVFGHVQALACAQARAAVVSPFLGRVRDWCAAHDPAVGRAPEPLARHPGILLVRRIRGAYAAYGYGTQVMAAGFRTVGEVVELGRLGTRGGADLVTLPPDLLDGLRRREAEGGSGAGFEAGVDVPPEPVYISPTGAGEEAYRRDLEAEKIAVDKVPEGLAKFSADAKILEDLVRAEVLRTQRGQS